MRSAVLLIYTTSVTAGHIQFRTHLVILVTPRVVLPRSHYPVQTACKDPRRIRHSPEHQVTHACMVCCTNVGRSGRRERSFLTQTQPHLFYDLERKRKVAEKDVDAEESDEREVPELAIQRSRAILARDVPVSRVNCVLPASMELDVLALLVGLTFGTGLEPFVDVTLLDEGVEDVEDAVAAPRLGAAFGTEHRELVVRFGRGARSEERKGLELVYELVDDIP